MGKHLTKEDAELLTSCGISLEGYLVYNYDLSYTELIEDMTDLIKERGKQVEWHLEED
jgi:hypothetical protein